MPWGEKGRDLDRSLHSGLEPLGEGEEGSQCRRYRNPGKVRGLLEGREVRGHGMAASLENQRGHPGVGAHGPQMTLWEKTGALEEGTWRKRGVLKE